MDQKATKQVKPSLPITILAMVVAAVLAYLKWNGRYSGSVATDQPKTHDVQPMPKFEAPRFEAPKGISTKNDAPRADANDEIVGDGGIGKLFRNRQSNVIVTTGGTVAKNLPDDVDTSDGSSKHQRMIVRLSTGDTILIAHNIDLAGRVPAKEGDVIKFCGEYEWTEKGGVVHWTHHDPRARRQDGWIEFAGKRYQ